MSKELNFQRFCLYTLGTRQPELALISRELSHWSNLDETVIGTVFVDLIDNDFGYAVLARDTAGRFRWVEGDSNIASQRQAEARLRTLLGTITPDAQQGDEPAQPLDLLTPKTVEEGSELHPFFNLLISNPCKAPARRVLSEIGPWLLPADNHLIGEFQRHQFDQRLWEFFLWAALREMNFIVEQLEAPDFLCSAPWEGISFSVEATTAAPSTEGPLAARVDTNTAEEIIDFNRGYMAIKYGSALFAKLMKRNAQGEHYWERERVRDIPFTLAIADFHMPGAIAEDDCAPPEIGSMVYSQTALHEYLYGVRSMHEHVDGQLRVWTEEIEGHTFGSKRIPSGFFNLPNAEHVAAVIFSNAGTIAKFDRMGVGAGFKPADCRYFRQGLRYDPDPNAASGRAFMEEIEIGHDERWADEIQIFHNPRAIRPLPEEWFPSAQHHRFDGDNIVSIVPGTPVLASSTLCLHSRAPRPHDE